MSSQQQNSPLASVSESCTNEVTIQSGETERQRKLAEIDAKIHDHIKAICVLNSQKNDLAPVSRLPVEIMAFIFSHLTRLRLRYRKRSWLIVTHVCKKWRQIAIETPELWSYIYSLRRRDAVEAFLKRSKAASLAIHVDIEVGTSNYGLVLEHWPRICSLELSSSHDDLLQKLHNSIPNSFKLQKLDLRCKRYDRYLNASRIVQSALQLKALSLRRSYLSWSSCTFENLSELVLEQIGRDAFKPTIVDILNILMRSTKLKVLQLDDVGPLDASTEFLPVVKLSNLEVFRLSSIDARVCFKLLRLLEHWERASWYIYCSDYPIMESTTIYPKFAASNAVCKLLALTVTLGYVDIRSSILDKSISASSTSADLMWDFEASLHPTDDSVGVLDTLSAIISSCAWKTALELDFKAESSVIIFSTEQWIKLLRLFNDLECLHCSFDRDYDASVEPEESLINALMHVMSGKMLCPKLSKIGLHWPNFLRTDGASTKSLLKCLKYRSENGTPVDTLEIQIGKGIDQENIDEFKRYVKNVEWDQFTISEGRRNADTESDFTDDSDAEDTSIFEGEGDL